MNYFTNLCRICMTRDKKLVNIYNADDDMLTYIDKLNTCVPEIFTESNYIPVPDVLCEPCCKNLKISFMFRELCLKSNTYFRKQKIRLEKELQRQPRVKEEAEELETAPTTSGVEVKAEEVADDSRQSVTTDKIRCDMKTTDDDIIIPVVDVSTTSLALEDRVFIKSEPLPEEQVQESQLLLTADYSSQLEEFLDGCPPTVDTVITPPTDENSTTSTSETGAQAHDILLSDMPLKQEKLESDVYEPKFIKLPNKQPRKCNLPSEFLCSYCGKKFKFRHDMLIHERIHTGSKPYVCPKCPKAFPNLARLKAHVNTHSKEKKFVCTVCKKAFRQHSNLSTHMKLHTTQESFVCTVCGKAFSQKRHLKQHTVFHKGERTFECTLCDWTFTMKHHLRRHMAVHTGIKPHKSTKKTLKIKERKFPCTMCEWSFITKTHLQKHIMNHMKENAKTRANLSDAKRQFPCLLCEWSFTKKHHLNRHLLKHENEKTFACKHCGLVLDDCYKFREHLQMHVEVTESVDADQETLPDNDIKSEINTNQ